LFTVFSSGERGRIAAMDGLFIGRRFFMWGNLEEQAKWG
jgi:hypothetical protein